jgi:hypothetical protein
LFSICYKTQAKACGYRIGLLQEPHVIIILYDIILNS